MLLYMGNPLNRACAHLVEMNNATTLTYTKAEGKRCPINKIEHLLVHNI